MEGRGEGDCYMVYFDIPEGNTINLELLDGTVVSYSQSTFRGLLRVRCLYDSIVFNRKTTTVESSRFPSC